MSLVPEISDALPFDEKRCIFIAGLTGTGKTWFELALARRFYRHGRNIVYYSPAMSLYEFLPRHTQICETMEEFEQSMMDTPASCGVLDECWVEMEPKSYNKFLFGICHSKRHMKMDLIYGCQSPSDIDVVFRKLADHIFVFRLSQEDSLWMGKHPAISPYVEEITALPNRVCLRFDKDPPRFVKRIDTEKLKEE